MRRRWGALLLVLALAGLLPGCAGVAPEEEGEPLSPVPEAQEPAEEPEEAPLPEEPDPPPEGGEHTQEELEEATGRLWDGPADGSLPPEDAALALAGQVAENFRDLPDWVEWKPADFQVGSAEVFDAYYGELSNFCFNAVFYVKLQDDSIDSPARGWWEMGSGLGEPETEGEYAGYYRWGREALAVKGEDGDWHILDWGTGGYSAFLPGWTLSVGAEGYLGTATLAELAELFDLTEGFTHDYLLPAYVCQRPMEDLAGLNELLAQRTEEEAQELCRALAAYLNAGYGADYSSSTLTSADGLDELLDPAYRAWTAGVPPLEL